MKSTIGLVQFSKIIFLLLLFDCSYSDPHHVNQFCDFTYPHNDYRLSDGSQCINSRGQYGVCTGWENCRSLNRFASDLCSFSVHGGLYCCANSNGEQQLVIQQQQYQEYHELQQQPPQQQLQQQQLQRQPQFFMSTQQQAPQQQPPQLEQQQQSHRHLQPQFQLQEQPQPQFQQPMQHQPQLFLSTQQQAPQQQTPQLEQQQQSNRRLQSQPQLQKQPQSQLQQSPQLSIETQRQPQRQSSQTELQQQPHRQLQSQAQLEKQPQAQFQQQSEQHGPQLMQSQQENILGLSDTVPQPMQKKQFQQFSKQGSPQLQQQSQQLIQKSQEQMVGIIDNLPQQEEPQIERQQRLPQLSKQGSIQSQQLDSQQQQPQLQENLLNEIRGKLTNQPQLFDDKFRAKMGTSCNTSLGMEGVCTVLHQCKDRTSVYIKDLCYYGTGVALYCCECCKETDSLLDGSEKRADLPRPIDKICDHYYPQSLKFAYGIKGVLALPQEYPYMAAIGWTDESGKISWECGGSVVTTKFILTAAHCTLFQGKQPDIARTGDLHLIKVENYTTPANFQITKVLIHPDYRNESIYHDIALLKIKQISGTEYNGVPACIWYQEGTPTIEMRALGYGTDSYSGPKTNELFLFYLNLLPQDECVQRVPAIPNYLDNGIIKSQCCAEDPKHIMDTCQGDSGGPILFNEYLGITPKPLIVGITSFGLYCAGKSPGVYTRTSEYIDWIEGVLLSDFDTKKVSF